MAKKYVSNKDVSVRIFRNGVLEWFTHVHPLVPHVLYSPLIVVMLYLSYGNGVGAGRIGLLFFGGVVLWTIAEYFVHRFAFHAGPKIEDEVRGIVESLPPGTPALGALRTSGRNTTSWPTGCITTSPTTRGDWSCHRR
jgi:hypothetical protein